MDDDSVVQSDWLAFVDGVDDASVDLFYVDPPFNTGKTQKGEAGAYADRWDTTDDWVEWFTARIKATLPKLKETSSVLIHVDWPTSHRVRVVLDELLGEDRFVNHLVWKYGL